MIKLVKPDKNLEKEIFDYKLEMINNGESDLNGCGGLHRYDNYDQWTEHINKYIERDRIDKESNFVEGSQWLLLDTNSNRILGMVNLRHYLNDFLRETGGHIGYSVRPSERRKGYGKKQLILALNILKQLGVKDVLITCDENNVASYKTIEACGGKLEDIFKSMKYGNLRRYWIEMQ